VISVTDKPKTHVDIGRMAHRYPNILIHCVFSTKERKHLIPMQLMPKLCKYFAGIGRKCGTPVLAAGGISNHVAGGPA
jgi:REP-associated tyrosine transposase